MKEAKTDKKEKIALSSQKNIKISPRKMSLLANVIRGKKTAYAVEYLKTSDKKGAKLLLNLVQSAMSNLGEVKDVVISDVKVGPGITMKRMNPVSRGRGHRILKRSTNVKVLVKETSLNNSVKKKKGEKDEQKG